MLAHRPNREKIKNSFDRATLVAMVGVCALGALGTIRALSMQQPPKINPEAERILSGSMQPTAVSIGKATLKSIAGNHREVMVLKDAYHKNGSIIEITVGLEDLNLRLDVRMENNHGVLDADKTYGVSYRQEVLSLKDVSTGGIIQDVSSDTESGQIWFGSYDSVTTTGVGGGHGTTANAGSLSPQQLHKEVDKITDMTKYNAKLTLNVLKSTTPAS